MSNLVVMLLSITFVDPAVVGMCKDADCNLLYTSTTVRACACNETVHSFVYPGGYNEVYVNYSMTSPIRHDFYQEHKLVGSCPTGLLCMKHINLDPTKELTTIIREYPKQDEVKTVLYSNDNYDLNFDTF